MPLLIFVLCVLAIAYRYYSAFLAARAAVLDDTRPTPAITNDDRRDFSPTHKWVLFGHHFAAISGAGPLIGPVLAAQFGYLPGLLWIVVGVCLAGAVQDFLVLTASMRNGGRSLARLAQDYLGRTAGIAATVAILFVIVIALGGLGKVVVLVLGGDAKPLPAGAVIEYPSAVAPIAYNADGTLVVPKNSTLILDSGKSSVPIPEGMLVHASVPLAMQAGRVSLPPGSTRVTPGSPWGLFTIAFTIPAAILVGFYIERLRKGHIIEASIIGAILVLAGVFIGGYFAESTLAHYLNLTQTQVTVAIAIYGFIAAVLPVWLLLCPRDYISSFLKIGTLALLVVGVLVANPHLEAPAFSRVFAGGGPVVGRPIFPFLFITIMCGAISGFHALVSSGTTSKMIRRESDARAIGYGAMLIEGLVGVVAIIAASSLPVRDYYAMNTDLDKIPAYHDRILEVAGGNGIEHIADYESLTQESLRGRTGGAVTLAVGMAHIFDRAASGFGAAQGLLNSAWKYWYHFAIMFEALFILTTIDAGTRIGRFLLQEIAGSVHPKLGLSGPWPASAVATAIIVAGWAWFLSSDRFNVIWSMFGIANQMLAVIALAVVTAWLIKSNRARYAAVSSLPMLAVITTTTTAAAEMLAGLSQSIHTQLQAPQTAARSAAIANNLLQSSLILAILLCTAIVVIAAARQLWTAMSRSSMQAGQVSTVA